MPPILYDYLGRPVNTGKLREEEAAPTVTGVRSVLTGHPADGLTPPRLAMLLRAAESGNAQGYLELAEQMEEKEMHYRSVLSTRKLQVSGLDVTVEAATDDAQGQKDAEFLRDVIATGTVQNGLYDMLDAVGKGYSASEIIWDTTGKLWLPSNILWRDQRWFQFSQFDGTTLELLGETGQPQPLTPYKYIVHTHKSKSGLPIRGGLARPVAWAYLFKNFDIKAWVQFAEVYGHPLRLGRYHAGASEKDKATLLAAVKNIAADACAIIPEGMNIDFIDAKASGNVVIYEKLADYLDKQTSKLVLGQTGTTDAGTRVGTANAHERVREDIEKADGKQLENTLNRDLVRPLIDLNFGPRKTYPRLRIYRPEQEDLSVFADNIVKLVNIGMRVEASVVRDKMGLPDPAKGAECLGPAATPPPAESDPAGQAAPPPAKAPHAAQGATSSQEGPALQPPVDFLGGVDLESEWEEQLAPMVNPVLELANRCTTAEEFLAALPGCIAAQNPEAMTEALARALFVAGLEGMGRGNG